MTGLRSGELARAAGVHPQTVRYYERRGLLAEPERTAGGHRVYPAEAVSVLRAVRAAQRLGFSLAEVAGLLGVRAGRRSGAADLRRQAVGKLAEVQERIAELQVAAAALRAAVEAGCADLVECAGRESCPIPFEASGGGVAGGG
ncbi:MerR family transcriptional regulator [Micromonospora siamensis]|uniref:DNA-binding transcriptional regulator, MerR family n=1 Tax=Micromonospora siamensis TaxID=299152 RepID=A0A1C5IGJ4_9ACTN|nr:MerR family transcriptional regulator [Micromonospora siamensis]SCG57542.1 DNA-binding transcriptional regulator, MerR family [Micromonospora siamensis]